MNTQLNLTIDAIAPQLVYAYKLSDIGTRGKMRVITDLKAFAKAHNMKRAQIIRVLEPENETGNVINGWEFWAYNYQNETKYV